MEKLCSLENVFYPPMGIAHITSDIADLVKEKVSGKSSIVIRTSSQPNSNPHLGTVMTMMTAYAIGQHMQDRFDIPANIIFDSLENSPAVHIVRDDIRYQISLSDIIDEGRPRHLAYLDTFRGILDFLNEKTDIPYRIRSYREFQQINVIRKSIIQILNGKEKFLPVLNPSEEFLHVRFPCPRCKLTDKSAVNVTIKVANEDEVVLANNCPDHGEHSISIRENNDDFFDANTSIRDILQGILSLEEGRIHNNLSIMVDGGDWSGVWALKVFCEGLMRFGYGELPYRLFAPVILDWSGAKFSKSMYLQSDAYKYLPEYLLDFSKFIDQFGEKGLLLLWEEAQNWAADPQKLFRSYSVEYFKLRLDKLITENYGK